MKKLSLIFGLAAALGAAAIARESAPGADVHAILNGIQAKMAPVKSVYLEFTQERVLKLFSDPLKSEGVLLLAQPDKIRWETTAPYQTILLGNGNAVAQFECNDGQWEKLKLGFPQMLQRVMQQMSALNQGRINAMLNDYDLSVTTNGGTVLVLVPKDATVRGILSSLEIHLTPDLAMTREVIMHEPNGDLTRITFQGEKQGVDFPTGTFNQNQPRAIAEVKAAIK
jgi:outer membrane lipoprotein-sorting protein